MKPSTERDYRERVMRTVLYIQQHLDDELNLDQLAAIAAFSRFHFHRVFRGMTGETLNEYIRRLRLERAAGQLKYLDRPITQIAMRAGFEAHESFTRAFGEMFSVSPSEYRAASLGRANYGGAMTVEIKEFPPRHVLALRHTGAYDQLGETWAKLMSWAGMQGLLGPDVAMIGISHDDPDVTPTGKLRYDAAVTVHGPVSREGEFQALVLVGGGYGIAVHRGPYSELPKTYQRLYGGWLPKSGYEPRDAPCFEHYVNSPQSASPEDLITMIHIPVE